MCDHFVAVQPETTIGKAIERLIEENAAILLVLDRDSQLVGTVPDSVMLRATIDAQLRNDPVSLHMNRRFVSVPDRAPIDIVLDQFVLHDLRSIPLLDQKRLAGVISRGELLRAAFGTVTSRLDAVGA